MGKVADSSSGTAADRLPPQRVHGHATTSNSGLRTAIARPMGSMGYAGALQRWTENAWSKPTGRAASDPPWEGCTIGYLATPHIHTTK